MEKLRKSLHATLQYIDAIVETRVDRRGNVGLVGVPWKEDPTLKAIMTDLKSQAQVISHSAVKFALLVNTSSPSDANLPRNITSICEEIGPQIGTFYNIFLRMTECAVAECLFDEAAQCVRSMLGIFEELLGYIKERNREAINYTAGEITKVLSEGAEALPLANKAAYRRYLSKKCKSLKEIVDEFSGYVDEAKESIAKTSAETAAASAVNEATHVFEKLAIDEKKPSVSVEDGDDEEEEDEDEMEERDYFASELPLVEGSVRVIQSALDAVKMLTVTITNVADTLLSSAAAAANEASASPADFPTLISENNAWVVSVLTMVDRIESISVDLGAALYPPVLAENEDLIQAYSQTVMLLKAVVEEVYEEVVPDGGKYRAYCDAKVQAELVKTRDGVVSLPDTLSS